MTRASASIKGLTQGQFPIDTNNNLVALAAGGTGGHVFPALAVARNLRQHGYRTILFTDRRGAKMAPAMNAMSGIDRVKIISAASPFQGGILRRITAMMKIIIGMTASWAAMIRHRPMVMIGFGGYPSFGPMTAAKLLGVPMMLHEQNGFLGRANRALARLAGHLALSWPATRNLPDNIKTIQSGMPVRDEFFGINSAPKLTKNGDINLLIIGGSQGAALFADLIPAAIALLDKNLRQRLVITQQCREDQAGQIEALSSAYAAMDVRATIAPFFDDVEARMDQSHLVITRSGASSVAELAAAGRAAIMIPLPTAMDDHQTMNARQLETVGGGVLAPQGGLDAAGLGTIISDIVTNPSRLGKMATDAKTLARPDAATSIAGYALSLAHGDTNGGSA